MVIVAAASNACAHVIVISVPVVQLVPVVILTCPPRSLPNTNGVPGDVPAAAPADADGV